MILENQKILNDYNLLYNTLSINITKELNNPIKIKYPNLKKNKFILIYIIQDLNFCKKLMVM